jgi:hypothetical protein
MPRRAAILALGLAVPVALWALLFKVDASTTARTEGFLARRQAAVDPPELWSIEVVPAQPGWPAVRLCADAFMRAGFVRPEGMAGNQPCQQIGEALNEPGRLSFRCTLNGHVLGTSARVKGDLASDFTAVYAVTDLSGFLAGRPLSNVEQTRRYRKLGACPAGWAVGDSTDRRGRRRGGALVVHSSPKTL